MPMSTSWKEMIDKYLPEVILSGVILMAIAWYIWAFVLPNHPSRPHAVPKSATLVFMNFTHYWQECWFDTSMRQDRCRIYNANGEILNEGVFLPIDGAPAFKGDKLRIVQGGNSYSVHLACGAVLIPQQHFDETRRELNGDFSKAK
jgi:hypothetical protein